MANEFKDPPAAGPTWAAGQFRTTHWSVVREAASPTEASRRLVQVLAC